MVHELFTIQNNRVDLRKLGSKARGPTPTRAPPLTAHPLRYRKITKSWCSPRSRTCSSVRRCTTTTVQPPLLRSRPVHNTSDRESSGDLGVAIKTMVDEFQSASKSNQNIQSIADMQRFIENYPEFRAKSGNVSKHVTLMGEMGRLIEERHLLQVSQVEQVSHPASSSRLLSRSHRTSRAAALIAQLRSRR